MRTFRLFLYLLSTLLFVVSIILLSLSSDSEQYSDPDDRSEIRRGFGGFLSFHNPGSLFGQAATISLTEDNSTFFAARPAAFGPLLPTKGLSGQIWVGGGFGDDNLKRRGIAAGVEGELGCNDIPGWDDHYWRLKDEVKQWQRDGDRSMKTSKASTIKADIKASKSKRDKTSYSLDRKGADQAGLPAESDGTDEYLQHPLPSTTIIRRSIGNNHKTKGGPTEHADIQSLQESAEIAGKVVILSRGGCGFAEKVKWAQRRGATAVIIGDNVLGGSLIRMYARCDTSNITIPSLFTSHMSAQLLSSLIPAGHDKDTSSSSTLWKWASTSSLDPFHTTEEHDNDQRASDLDQAKSASKQKGTSQVNSYEDTTTSSIDDDANDASSSGWIKSSLSAVGLRTDDSRVNGGENSRRPPSSGQLTWSKSTESKGDGVNNEDSDRPKSQYASKGFIIGVQDWRDPDVVLDDGTPYDPPSSSSTSAPSRSTMRPEPMSLKGGSITPGSGEYEKVKNPLPGTIKAPASKASSSGERSTDNIEGESWFNILSWADANEDDSKTTGHKKSSASLQSLDGDKKEPNHKHGKDQFKTLPVDEVIYREGLWVTLTPTDMNASPFLNTLFVLVVSPLMTLAIVYSMLLLRSRIRRRRWRAPKSVVERLPVHIYHRLSGSNSGSGSENENQPSSTATTPLLPSSRPTDISPRPRSNTVCGPPASLASSSRYGSLEPSSEQEKVSAGLTEWRRKYRGKQVECVVCLEEYVDGVSKVMSLPCGHEFHVDCITPWLTTRRRTCPICKGDVVRSIGRPASRGHTAAMNDMTEEDVQIMTAETRNDAPSSAIPILPPNPEPYLEHDLERAQDRPSSRQGSTSPSWLSRSVTRGLGYLGAQSPDEHDHHRTA